MLTAELWLDALFWLSGGSQWMLRPFRWVTVPKDVRCIGLGSLSLFSTVWVWGRVKNQRWSSWSHSLFTEVEGNMESLVWMSPWSCSSSWLVLSSSCSSLICVGSGSSCSRLGLHSCSQCCCSGGTSSSETEGCRESGGKERRSRGYLYSLDTEVTYTLFRHAWVHNNISHF